MSLVRPQLARIATRSFHASPPARGGGSHPPYPHHVWSPAGGWWSNASDWKQNCYIAGAIGVFLWGMVFQLSASIEVRAHRATRARPVRGARPLPHPFEAGDGARGFSRHFTR